MRAGAHVVYPWRIGRDGSVEAGAATIERSVARAIDAALDGMKTPIAAVAVAAFWHSLVGVDAHGRAVTSVLPWTDLRSADQVDALRADIDERAVHARTGCRIHASYWPARFRWFRERDPKTFRRVKRWLSFPAYLDSRWLGRLAESRSQASGTGLFLHDTSSWDAELCEACGVSPDRLAPIVDLDDASGELGAPLVRRWPALRGARWIPAVGDGAANNLGSGCTSAGRAALMIGTSGALRQSWTTDAAPVVPFGLFRYWVDRRRVVVGGALSNGGNLAAWMRQTLGFPADPRSRRHLDARLARMRPDAHGLTVLPFLAGERSPDYPTDARATIAGLRLATTREDIVRAGLEAVGYRFLDVLERLIEVGPVTRLVATGTALTSSRVWPQMLADILGRPTELPRQSELTGRGAAIVGFEQLGVPTAPGDAPAARVFHPDAAGHRMYRAGADRQRRLIEAAGAI